MPGALLSLPGTDGSVNAFAYAPPVTRSLEYSNVFSSDATKTTRNLVVGKAKPALTGAPTLNANSAVFAGGVSFLDLALTDPLEATIIAVARSQNPTSGVWSYIASTFTGAAAPTSNGITFGFDNNNKPTALVDHINGSTRVSNADTINTTAISTWGLWVLRAGATLERIENLTTGQAATGAITYPRAPSNGLALRIGSSRASNAAYNAGTIEIMEMMVHSAILTDAELASQAAFMRGIAANRGATV